jgi:tryptophan synthase alpha chain
MTPTNSLARLQEIARHARGFVYCVARKGVTGRQTHLDDSLEAFMARCRQATSLPLALGFGLRTGADLRRLHGLADMGILGTALLTTWEQGGAAQYEQLLQDLRAATVTARVFWQRRRCRHAIPGSTSCHHYGHMSPCLR